jgi:hypothetical protein
MAGGELSAQELLSRGNNRRDLPSGSGPTITMNTIDLILMLGGSMAALAVCVVCGVGFVVWLAGGRIEPPK